jgi:hypothetical protein
VLFYHFDRFLVEYEKRFEKKSWYFRFLDPRQGPGYTLFVMGRPDSEVEPRDSKPGKK